MGVLSRMLSAWGNRSWRYSELTYNMFWWQVWYSYLLGSSSIRFSLNILCLPGFVSADWLVWITTERWIRECSQADGQSEASNNHKRSWFASDQDCDMIKTTGCHVSDWIHSDQQDSKFVEVNGMFREVKQVTIFFLFRTLRISAVMTPLLDSVVFPTSTLLELTWT